MVKNLSANAGNTGDLEDPLEWAMSTHSSILAWRMPWTEAWRATVQRVTKSGT